MEGGGLEAGWDGGLEHRSLLSSLILLSFVCFCLSFFFLDAWTPTSSSARSSARWSAGTQRGDPTRQRSLVQGASMVGKNSERRSRSPTRKQGRATGWAVLQWPTSAVSGGEARAHALAKKGSDSGVVTRGPVFALAY